MVETYGEHNEQTNNTSQAASFCQEQIAKGLYSKEDIQEWAEKLLDYKETINTSNNDQMHTLVGKLQETAWTYKSVQDHLTNKEEFLNDCLLGPITKEAIELAIAEKDAKTREEAQQVSGEVEENLQEDKSEEKEKDTPDTTDGKIEAWLSDPNAECKYIIHEDTGRKNKKGETIYREGEVEVASSNKRWIVGSSTVKGFEDLPKDAGKIGIRSMSTGKLRRYLIRKVFPALKENKIKIPDEIIIAGTGINSLMGNGTVENTLEEYEKLAQMFKNLGAKTIKFVTLQPYEKISDKIIAFNKLLRNHPQYECLDLSKRISTTDNKWKDGMHREDGLHLSKAGYKELSMLIDKETLQDYRNTRTKRMYA